jgi:hypothetical protein
MQFNVFAFPEQRDAFHVDRGFGVHPDAEHQSAVVADKMGRYEIVTVHVPGEK